MIPNPDIDSSKHPSIAKHQKFLLKHAENIVGRFQLGSMSALWNSHTPFCNR